MNFNNLKRKGFFWLEKLQISRRERITFSLLLGILVVLFLLSLFLQQSFTYDQANYEQIMEEFDKRSAVIEQQTAVQNQGYSADSDQGSVPAIDSEEMVGEASANSEPTTSSEHVATGPVNINTASKEQLQTLNGIGPAYAQNIIDYREANDGFDSIDELINVKGIGEKRLENIRAQVTIKD